MGQAISPEKQGMLIVEDEAFIRHDLADFFADAGFEVFDAADADEAMELMAAHSTIRVVLTDVEMPGTMNGVKLSHYLHAHYPSAFLLITSGAVKLAPTDIPAGAAFIAKPFDPHAVLRTIRTSAR